MKKIPFACILALAALSVGAEEPACPVGYVHCSQAEGCCPVAAAVQAHSQTPPEPVPPLPDPKDPK